MAGMKEADRVGSGMEATTTPWVWPNGCGDKLEWRQAGMATSWGGDRLGWRQYDISGDAADVEIGCQCALWKEG